MDEEIAGLYKRFENRKIDYEVKKKERQSRLKILKVEYGINSIEEGLSKAEVLSNELEELSKRHINLKEEIARELEQYE
jgi:hypothetical protein